MKLSNITFFAFIITFLTATSQPKKEVLGVDIKLSKEVKTKGGLSQSLLGQKDGKIYTNGIKGFYLWGIPIGIRGVYNVWDQDMNLVNEGKQQKKRGNIKLKADDYARTYMIGDEIVQLVTTKKKKRIHLYVIQINSKNFTIKKSIKVHEISAKRKDKDNYGIIVTKDKKNFAFVIYNGRGRSTEISLKVFNKDLEEIATIKDKVPYLEREINIERFNAHGRNRIFFILNRSYRKKGERELQNDKILYQFNHKEEKIEAIEIEGAKYDILSYDYTYYNGKIFLTGCYEKDNKEESSGVFTRVYDTETLSVLNEEYKDFSFEFITEDFSEKEKKRADRKSKKGKDFNRFTYKVKDVFAVEDGYIAMAERYRTYTTRYRSTNGTWITNYHYIYNEIVLFKFDENGAIAWVEKIKKKQHTTNDGGLNASFYFKVVDDNLFTVHSESVSGKGVTVFISRVDTKTGDLKTKEAFSEETTNDVVVHPNSSFVEIDKNTTMFKGYKKKGLIPNYKKLTFVTLEF